MRQASTSHFIISPYTVTVSDLIFAKQPYYSARTEIGKNDEAVFYSASETGLGIYQQLIILAYAEKKSLQLQKEFQEL